MRLVSREEALPQGTSVPSAGPAESSEEAREDSEQERAKVRCVFCKGHFGSTKGNQVPTLYFQQGDRVTSL